MYLTSDQHYGHKNVIKYCRRPFAINMDDATMDEVLHMNEVMVANYNQTVGQDGYCLHVGDFSLALNHVDVYGPRLLGKKELVPGNHDWCHSVHSKKKQKTQQAMNCFINAGFMVMPETIILEHDGFKIKVCHLPYAEGEVDNAEYTVRYKEIRPIPEDEDFLICGHVHNNWKMKKTPSGKLMYNVGVDVHDFKPVHIEQIIKDVREFNEKG